jgi:cytochrome c
MRALMMLAVMIGLSLPVLAQEPANDPKVSGEKVFLQCRACHQVGEGARNGIGPQLNGLFGRKAGTAPNYTYSAAYQGLDKTWSEENFRTYIKDPRGVTPGTKMVYAGLKDDAKINDLVIYLKQFSVDGKKAE